MTNSILLSLMLLLNRLSLGAYFIVGGYHKIFVTGVDKFYEESFVPLQPQWLPETVGLWYGKGLPILELFFGVMLVLGVFGRLAAFAVAGMLASFTVALVIQSGDLAGGGGGLFHYNVILFTLALMLLCVGPGKLSIDACLFRKKQEPPKDQDQPRPRPPSDAEPGSPLSRVI